MPRTILPLIAIFLTLALLPAQHAHRSPGRSFRGRSFRSGGPNYWHFGWGGNTWPRRRGGGPSSSSFGGRGLQPYNFQPRAPPPPDPLWSEVVPARLSAAPAETARLSWPPTKSIGLNATALTGWLEDRPELGWAADRRALYTVMIVDEGIERLEGKQFIHWLVTNVPGSDVARGAEVMQYIPPFAVELGSDGAIDESKSHPMLALIYRQRRGQVEVEEFQRGCSPTILSDRINDKDALAAKYDLDLVAGTFFRVPFSPTYGTGGKGAKGTEYQLCRASKCTKAPFPIPLPGVNDGPDCQPDTRLLGQFWKGPKRSQLGEYAKYISVWNPDSITSTIRSLKGKGVSTGVSQEFNALYGTFRSAPSLTGNLETTLDGDMGVDFFGYQSIEAAKRLFVGPDKLGDEFPEMIPPVLAVLPTFAGDNFYHITVGQPDDQDFSIRNLIPFPEEFPEEERSEEVMWIQLANVKPGKRERFLELRKRLLAKAANSPVITAWYTFDMDVGRGVGPLADQYAENENAELMMYVAKSRAEQTAWLNGLAQSDPAFLTEFLGTFDCIACALVDTRLLPEYFPPFKSE